MICGRGGATAVSRGTGTLAPLPAPAGSAAHLLPAAVHVHAHRHLSAVRTPLVIGRPAGLVAAASELAPLHARGWACTRAAAAQARPAPAPTLPLTTDLPARSRCLCWAPPGTPAAGRSRLGQQAGAVGPCNVSPPLINAVLTWSGWTGTTGALCTKKLCRLERWWGLGLRQEGPCRGPRCRCCHAPGC